jgi:hypothetical protein
VRCALCAVRCALCAVRCALCAVRCVLCAVLCALRCVPDDLCEQEISNDVVLLIKPEDMCLAHSHVALNRSTRFLLADRKINAISKFGRSLFLR